MADTTELTEQERRDRARYRREIADDLSFMRRKAEEALEPKCSFWQFLAGWLAICTAVGLLALALPLEGAGPVLVP